MIGEYEVHFFEDTFESNNRGDYNPLHLSGCYGFQMFQMEKVDKILFQESTKVFALEFLGEINHDDGEVWAEPLRIEALSRLKYRGYLWYLSFWGELEQKEKDTKYITINDEFKNRIEEVKNLQYVFINSDEFYNEKEERIFIETPYYDLKKIISRYWSNNIEGTPIQGLLMKRGNLSNIQHWGRQKTDIHLLRQIMDEIFIGFYTYPAENRHFGFYTNKLSFDQFKKLINPEELQIKATEIGKRLQHT